MFDKATRMKLRFPTTKGMLSTEDLWDLPLESLNSLAKGFRKKLQDSAEVDFLDEKSEEDVVTKLQFDITLAVLEVKKTEKKNREQASAKKAEKQKLLGILAKKQDDELEKLTPEELQKRIADLG